MKLIRTLLAILCAGSVTAASAAPLTPEQALAGVRKKARIAAAGDMRPLELRLTRQAEGLNTIYVFAPAASDGFIVTAADDSAPLMLGYSDAPLTDNNGNMAPGLEYWLDQLSREVSYTISHPEVSARRIAAVRNEREPIDPLCKTLWSQTEPYNNDCPTLNGEKCVTGCAATSAAQVMKYHNWPQTGEGYVSYKWKSGNQNLSLDLSAESFNWADMLDKYTADSSAAQRQAVAQLLKAIGYALHMEYSPVASGASPQSLPLALAENFRYDRRLRYLDRDCYSLHDWEDIIYESLRKYGPVIYNGQSNAGGHSFVCDGYSEKGYFHINWGWAGVSDGYFLLNTLNPHSQGTGGSGDGSGFNFMQDIICDIRPAEADNPEECSGTLRLYSALELIYSKPSNTVTMNSRVYNPGPGTLFLKALALEILPVNIFGEATGDPQYISIDIDSQLEATITAYNFIFSLNKAELGPGRYLLTIKYDDGSGTLMPVTPLAGKCYSYILRKSESGTINLRARKTNVPVVLSSQIPETISKERSFTVRCIFENPTPIACTGTLMGAFVKGEEILAKTDTGTFFVEGDKEANDGWEMDFMNADLAGGTYPFMILANDGASGYIPLTEPVNVTFNAPSGVTDIDADTDGLKEYFTPGGVKVDAASLQPGLYIVRDAGGARKIIIR